MSRFCLLFLLGIFPCGFLKNVEATNCNETYGLWQCLSGDCINNQQLCDGTKQCPDGSDETINSCRFVDCFSSSFRCDYGACIPFRNLCDGVPDCADFSDENIKNCLQLREGSKDNNVDDETNRMNCAGWGQMKCWTGQQCFESKDKCNGIRDCTDGSDETELFCKDMSCTMKQFRCDYGACIPSTAKCNGTKECFDGSDEQETLCKEDDVTEATISVTSATFLTPNDISSFNLDIPFENDIDEKFISEYRTNIIDTITLPPIPAQRGSNNLYDNKNAISSRDDVIREKNHLRTNSKYDHNDGSTYMNVDHMTSKPDIDYTMLQNVRPAAQTTAKEEVLEPMPPPLKSYSIQPMLLITIAPKVQTTGVTKNICTLRGCEYPLKCEFVMPAELNLSCSINNRGRTILEGSEVRFSCTDNHILDGANRSKCTATGWSHIKPNCRKITSSCDIDLDNICTFPMICERFDINNKQLSNEQKQIFENQQIKFSCRDDNRLEGAERLTCTKNGWNNPIPKCSRMCKGKLIPTCKAPLKCKLYNPSSGFYQIISNRNRPRRKLYPQDTEVTFRCADGYKLQGENRTICGGNGWSHEERNMVPTCTTLCDNKIFETCKHPVQCYYFKAMKTIKINRGYMESVVPVGAVIHFQHMHKIFSRLICTATGWISKTPNI